MGIYFYFEVGTAENSFGLLTQAECGFDSISGLSLCGIMELFFLAMVSSNKQLFGDSQMAHLQFSLFIYESHEPQFQELINSIGEGTHWDGIQSIG